MLTFGLVVEGIYDEAALKELIQKCVSEELNIISRSCGNAPQLMKRFPGFLEEFKHAKEGSNVDRAIVIRDADRKDPRELIARMQDKISGHTYIFPVRPLVVVQELEAWLLADEQAMSAVTGRKQAPIHRPEEIPDPKGKLKSILSDANIGYTPEIARKIAERADVATIESRCAWFKQFRQSLI